MAMKPTITIGTGYELQQKKAASRRKIAEAMLTQGLQSNPNMTSWAQVLGQAAQAWAGKSMQKDADKMDADVSGLIREDYTKRRGDFYSRATGMAPQEVVANFGNDPLLEAEVEPYREALQRALTEREKLGDFGGRVGVRLGDVAGQYNNDPNQSVHVLSDGTMVPNGPKIAASIASQGLPLTDKATGQMLYAPTGQLPGSMPPAAPVGLAALPSSMPRSNPGAEDATFEQFQGAYQALGPQEALAFFKRSGARVIVSDPSQANQLPPGMPYVTPDGQEFVR